MAYWKRFARIKDVLVLNSRYSEPKIDHIPNHDLYGSVCKYTKANASSMQSNQHHPPSVQRHSKIALVGSHLLKKIQDSLSEDA